MGRRPQSEARPSRVRRASTGGEAATSALQERSAGATGGLSMALDADPGIRVKYGLRADTYSRGLRLCFRSICVFCARRQRMPTVSPMASRTQERAGPLRYGSAEQSGCASLLARYGSRREGCPQSRLSPPGVRVRAQALGQHSCPQPRIWTGDRTTNNSGAPCLSLACAQWASGPVPAVSGVAKDAAGPLFEHAPKTRAALGNEPRPP